VLRGTRGSGTEYAKVSEPRSVVIFFVTSSLIFVTTGGNAQLHEFNVAERKPIKTKHLFESFFPCMPQNLKRVRS